MKYVLTPEQTDALEAAQEKAAKAFWAYPGREWQADFQAGWLLQNVGVSSARCHDGFFWGEENKE